MGYIIKNIPIKPFALANGLKKSEFIELAKENGWLCHPSRYPEVMCDFGKYGRFAFFDAKRSSLAGFKNPARVKK